MIRRSYSRANCHFTATSYNLRILGILGHWIEGSFRAVTGKQRCDRGEPLTCETSSYSSDDQSTSSCHSCQDHAENLFMYSWLTKFYSRLLRGRHAKCDWEWGCSYIVYIEVYVKYGLRLDFVLVKKANSLAIVHNALLSSVVDLFAGLSLADLQELVQSKIMDLCIDYHHSCVANVPHWARWTLWSVVVAFTILLFFISMKFWKFGRKRDDTIMKPFWGDVGDLNWSASVIIALYTFNQMQRGAWALTYPFDSILLRIFEKKVKTKAQKRKDRRRRAAQAAWCVLWTMRKFEVSLPVGFSVFRHVETELWERWAYLSWSEEEYKTSLFPPNLQAFKRLKRRTHIFCTRSTCFIISTYACNSGIMEPDGRLSMHIGFGYRKALTWQHLTCIIKDLSFNLSCADRIEW